MATASRNKVVNTSINGHNIKLFVDIVVSYQYVVRFPYTTWSMPSKQCNNDATTTLLSVTLNTTIAIYKLFALLVDTL